MEFAIEQPEANINTEISPSQTNNVLSKLNNFRTENTPRDLDPETENIAMNPYRKNILTDPDPLLPSDSDVQDAESPTEIKMTLQEKVFVKLLAEEPNQHCFDCGWPDPTHVSVNHGIFLCSNCALGIHMVHYPVEVSYIKSVEESNFNYLQLRVLINGGNQAAFDFFEVYDL